ncbi:MAG: hypothetical protein H0X34_09615 [Chthoniobacterales bacterium]|nr:hypothetical protein [Chthoniobacterales bacterium]
MSATTSAPVLRSTKITVTARTSGTAVNATGKVAVQDANGLAIPGATVAITWKVPSGATQRQTAVTSSRGMASFAITDIAGSCTLTVTDTTKAGYTFDAAGSVLTRKARSR